MTTKKDLLVKDWAIFGALMRAKSSPSTRDTMEMFLSKPIGEVVSWMMCMGSGDHRLDAQRVAQYLGVMYNLDSDTILCLETIMERCLILCAT